jgi:hypothetical protein
MARVRSRKEQTTTNTGILRCAQDDGRGGQRSVVFAQDDGRLGGQRSAGFALERRRQVRGSLLLAGAVLVFAVGRAILVGGVHQVFGVGWWRLW